MKEGKNEAVAFASLFFPFASSTWRQRLKKTLAFKGSFPMGLRSDVVGLGLRLRGLG